MRQARKSRRADNGPKRDYPVGYGQAPISGRWKPGQSGNPKGRKKGAKSVSKIIEEALMRKVSIVEDGRRVRLTVQEVIIRNLANAAARGDMKAVVTLFRLRDHYHDSTEIVLNPDELDLNDQAIIEEYLQTIQAASAVSLASAYSKSDAEQMNDKGNCTLHANKMDGES